MGFLGGLGPMAATPSLRAIPKIWLKWALKGFGKGPRSVMFTIDPDQAGR